MWHGIYIKPFEGPDAVPFTTGMQNCIAQSAPLAYYGTLVTILSTIMGRTIGRNLLARQKQGA